MSYRSGRRYGRTGYRQSGLGTKVPVEVGKEYEADITEMSHRGDAGVAKIQGFVIFVSGTKQGEHVKFKVTRVARRFATAEKV